MRTRSRVTGAGRSVFTAVHKNSRGQVVLGGPQDMAYLGLYKTITDEEHPNFKYSQSQGVPVIGPLSVSESETIINESSFTYPEGDGTTELSGDLITPLGIFSDTVDISVQRNSAINACKALAAISALKKLNTAQIDTGEILGTLGSTIATFRNPFAAFAKVFAKMEKTRIKQYGKLRKRRVVADDQSTRGDWYEATAKAWLVHSFAIQPVFGDISKTISIYEDQVALFQEALRVAKGMSVRTVTGAGTTTYVHGGENLLTGMVAETTRGVSEKIQIASGVYYKIPMNYSPVARALGLGLHNVASSVWNLTPYSWLLDQVVNVGDWIQAATPDPDLLYYGTYTTTKSVKSVVTSTNLKIRRTPPNGSPTWFSASGGSANQRIVSISREPGVTLPSTPQWNPQMSFLAQALNNAAFGLLQIKRAMQRFHH